MSYFPVGRLDRYERVGVVILMVGASGEWGQMGRGEGSVMIVGWVMVDVCCVGDIMLVILKWKRGVMIGEVGSNKRGKREEGGVVNNGEGMM